MVTALLFFLFPAFLIILGTQGIKEEKKAGNQKRPSSLLTKFLAVLIFIFGTRAITNIFLADVNFAQAMSLSKQGYLSTADLKFTQAIRSNPLEPAYHREYAFNLVQEALSQEDGDEDERVKLVTEAVVQSETAYRLNRLNSLTLKSLLRTYYALARIDPRFEKDVEEYAQRITQLARTEPRAFYDTALIMTYLGKREEAVLFAQKAIKLKPNYQEAAELLLKLEDVTESNR